MTTDEAAVLMNEYFDNELSDSGLQTLFTQLGESAESRALFLSMKQVHESLMQSPGINYPQSIDQKFTALRIEAKKEPLINRTFTVSLRSGIYSTCAAIVIGLFMYAVGSYQEQAMGAQYRQTISAMQQHKPNFIDRD